MRTASLVVPLVLAAALGWVPAVRADELADAAARGAKLFAAATLGTNGKSCAVCHADAAAFAGKARFPRVAFGGLRTLDQAIQTCVVNALAGAPLAWDDGRLTALAVFLDSRFASKK